MNRQPDFAALLQALPDPFLVLTPDLRIQAVNDVFLATTGRCRIDILERRLFDDVFPDPGGDEAGHGRRRLRTSISTALNTGTANVADVHRYDLPNRPDGKPARRYWSVINSPIISGDGTIAHLAMRVQDVTAARGMLSGALGRLTSALNDENPGPVGHREFTEYLADPGRRSAGTEELQHQVDLLLTTLTDRTVIEQAKGMLMITRRVDADAAYTLLRKESQHTNVKLRDVAARHVALQSGPGARSPDDCSGIT